MRPDAGGHRGATPALGLWVRESKAGVRKGSSPPAPGCTPRCQCLWATELSAGSSWPWERPCSQPVQSARPGYSRTCGGGLRVPECPRVPGALGAPTCAPESSAYHGTWSAGGGCSHDDWDCSRSELSTPIITPWTPVIRRVAARRYWAGQSRQLAPLTHAAPSPSIPGEAACMHHPLARRSDFAITSVGSAGRVGRVLSVSTLRWVFRFNVWVLYP